MSPPKLSFKKEKMGDKAFQSLGTIEQTLRKGPVFPILIIMSAILYFILLCLNGLSANPKMSYGLFNHTIGNISKMYPLNITPAGWTFSIWGIIFLSQIASSLYSLGLLCRQTNSGPAYLHPPVLSPLYFVLFSLSSVFVGAWLFMWDRFLFLACAIFLLCCVICLWTAYSIAAERLQFFRSELVDNNRSLDITVIFVSVVNGLGMYATWSVIATIINIGVVLVYRLDNPLANESASIICLSLVALFLLAYASLDMTIYESINRFTFTPYLTIVWALSGVVSKNWNPDENVSSILTAILLGCSVVALLGKIALSVFRLSANRNPYRRMKVAIPMN